METWALMQEPASTTWWSIGRGTCMEVVRTRETHAGRSAADKMKMASLLGNVAENKFFPTFTKINLWSHLATRERSAST